MTVLDNNAILLAIKALRRQSFICLGSSAQNQILNRPTKDREIIKFHNPHSYYLKTMGIMESSKLEFI